MRLVVVSHKPCWPSSASPSGYATDGGFPFQIRALSELFDATTLIVPCSSAKAGDGEMPLTGHRLSIAPIVPPFGNGVWRKIGFVFWVLRTSPVLIREMRRADAVHAAIPGDVGTVGMLMAFVLRKPLFVRHCGNWFVQRTVAEHFWKWFMEQFAGGKNVMLATGGNCSPPSQRNKNVRWIFSTTLTKLELTACRTRRNGPPDEEPRLIIVCRQEQEKGTDLLLRSLPIIMRNFPHTMLDVVGEGSALAEFRKLAAALGVSEQTTFHGKVDHATVIRLLKQAHLFCYPTMASEGFPKVVLEALACGLPVITTRVSVLPELIGYGAGILLDEVTPESLAQAIGEILDDTERYEKMSACAFETARQYSLERWRDRIGELLQATWAPLRTDA